MKKDPKKEGQLVAAYFGVGMMSSRMKRLEYWEKKLPEIAKFKGVWDATISSDQFWEYIETDWYKTGWRSMFQQAQHLRTQFEFYGVKIKSIGKKIEHTYKVGDTELTRVCVYDVVGEMTK